VVRLKETFGRLEREGNVLDRFTLRDKVVNILAPPSSNISNRDAYYKLRANIFCIISILYRCFEGKDDGFYRTFTYLNNCKSHCLDEDIILKNPFKCDEMSYKHDFRFLS
jgi:hypothetical protein